MVDSYFVLSSGEDGISIRGPYAWSKLSEMLNEGHWGQRGFYDKVPDMDKGYFDERDGQEKLLIIRGSIVVPQAKQVVTEWAEPT